MSHDHVVKINESRGDELHVIIKMVAITVL
jgi:hypothetical protein